MDCETFESFLDFIRNTKEVPTVERGDLEKKLMDIVTLQSDKEEEEDKSQCHRCGCETVRDEKGNKKLANGPDFYHRKQLQSLFAEAVQTSKLPIEAWAPVLSTAFIMENYPYSKNKELWKQFVLDEKKRIQCPDDVNYATLPEAEKVFFYEKSNWSPFDSTVSSHGSPGFPIDCSRYWFLQQAESARIQSYARNYELLRIMAKLGGEGGVMGFFDKVSPSEE